MMAGVAELVDAQRLGRCSQRSVGSSPAARTTLNPTIFDNSISLG